MTSGILWVISFFFNLFQQPQYSILLIDEIENGMHMGRIARLIDVIRTIARDRKVQILFSTHSHEILKYLLGREVINTIADHEKGSQYQLLSDSRSFDKICRELGDPDAVTADQLLDSGFF